MPIRRIRQGAGLQTDRTALEPPEGGMRQADNVLINRPGIIEPRLGFGDTTGIDLSPADGKLPVRGWPWREYIVLQHRADDGSAWRLISQAGDDFNAVAPPSGRGSSDATLSRENLYITSSTGLQVVHTLSDAAARAGAWTYYQAPSYSFIDLTVASEDADHASIASNSSVAYRWVLRTSDELGYEKRSAPSARQICRVPSSYATGARVELGTIKIHPEWAAGDVLELYRTRNSGSETADPGEDYYLTAEYVLTSSDISTGYTADDIWDDRTPDDALGPALYTSVSQLGAAESKEVPPQAGAVAEWKNCLWLGDTLSRAAVTLQIREVRATPASDGTGLCGDITGTYAGVSGNDLTGVTLSAAEWASLAVGMWIADGGAPGSSSGGIPTGTTITAFDSGAGTITLSAAPSGTGNITAGDIVTVNGTNLYCWTSESLALQRFAQSTDADPATRCYETALSLASVIAYNAETLSATAIKDEQLGAGDGTFLVIDDDPVDQALTITCASRGGAFVPDISSGYDVDALNDPARPGGLSWSAVDEPEAFPPLQNTIVGNRGKQIIALTPLDAALIVWKEDGIFRVTGFPPDGFVVDELSASSVAPIRLLSPRCVCILGRAVYAWTNQGVIEVTEGGISRIISEPIADVLRVSQQQLPLGDANGQRGFWMEAHPRLGLVVLSLASSSSAEYGAEQYVWSRATGAWTRWDRQDRCMVYDPAEDRMLACPAGEQVYAVGENGFSASNYYDMESASIYEGSDTMTRSALIRYDTTTAGRVFLEQITGSGGWQMSVDASSKARFTVSDGTQYHGISTTALTPGTVYCITGSYDGASVRLVVTPYGGSSETITPVSGSRTSPGGGVASLGYQASEFTILGIAMVDATALSDAQMVAHNAATLAAMEMQQIGSGSYYRANRVGGLADDASGAFDWTENGSVTGNVAVALDFEPFAYYERADRTAAASYVDATKTDIPIYAVSGDTVTVRKTDLDGFTIPACSTVYVDPGESLPGYQGYGRVTTSADSSTYGAGFIDLTVSWEASTGSPATTSRTLDVYQGWSAAMLWQAVQLPGLGNRWQEHHVAFEAAESAYLTDPTISVGGAAHRDSSPSSVSPTFPTGITYSEVVRTGLPRACVRTPHLYPYVRICGAGLLWELSETTLHHTPTSRRVNR